MLRTSEVACQNGRCVAAGIVRTVHARLVAIGVVELPRLLCAECGWDMRQVGGWPPASGGYLTSDAVEALCPGSSCSTSPEQTPPSDSGTEPNPPTTARATGRRSRPSTATGTANSAAGSNPGTGGEAA